MSRQSSARLSAERRRCPDCQRGAALSVVLNPGTVSTVCRWCDHEKTTVIADLEPTDSEGE